MTLFLAGLAAGLILWSLLGVLCLRAVVRCLGACCPLCDPKGELEQRAFLRAVAALQPRADGHAVWMWMREELGRSVSCLAVYTAAEKAEAAGLVSSWEEEGGPERGWRKRRLWTVTAREGADDGKTHA